MRFNYFFIFLFIIFFQTRVFAQELNVKPDPLKTWDQYEAFIQKQTELDRKNGLAYIISGSIALAGGLAGSGVTVDPLEKGIYALFQTIGVASVGYGAYRWQIGSEDRLLFSSLQETASLNDKQKLDVIRSYEIQKKQIEAREKMIRVVVHGLIAGLNLYNGSQQSNESVKNTLFFIGGANLLASISYAF
jgi:hypothetical protein